MPDGFRIAAAWVEVFPQLASDARQRLQAQMDAALSGAGATARVGIDVDSAKLTAAKAELDEFGTKDETARARVDTGDSTDHLDDLGRRLSGIGGKDETARVHVDTGDSQEKLAALDEELRSKPGDMAAAGNAAGSFSGRLALIAAAVPAVASALPAVGGAVAGVGGALAAGGLAFGGISQAMSDYMAVQNQAGQSASQMAATEFANAVAVQNAQRAISDAEQQAAQDAITSAQQIVSAQQQVASSEHQLAQAQYSEQQAQTALTQARIQARQQLEQLNNAEIDGRLSVRSAQLALQQAQLQQQQTDQNAMSTQLQREQTALAVAQAERQLIEARQGESNATDAANRANKQGVDGNPQVLAAQHSLKDAIYGVGQARQAEQNAIKALAMVREQAAYQQQRDAEAIQVAQQNLANTEKQQQLQMAASGNAAQKLARDMSVLTGPQRALVREFEGFNGVLTRMERIAGKAVLPGVTEFLRGVHALLPTVDSAIAKFGGVFGAALGDIGKAFSSARFREDLTSIINQGVRFMRLLEPLAGAVGSLFDLWGKGAPATEGLAKGLAAIAGGFGHLFAALEPAVKPAGQILQVLGQAIGDLGGPLGQVLSALLQSLAPVLQALLPGFKALADALGAGLAAAVRGLAPVLVPLAHALSAIVQAAAPLLPVIGTLIGEMGRALAPVMIALTPIVTQLATLLAQDMDNGLSQVMAAITQILPPLAQLVVSLSPLISLVLRISGVMIDLSAKLTGPVVTALATVVGGVLGLAAHWRTAFGDIGGAVTWFWQHIIQPLWNDWIKPVFSLIQAGVDAFQGNWSGAWKEIGNAAKAPVNFLIGTVYDDGIRRFWDDVVSAIGMSALKLPLVPKLAGGGIVPGVDHGRDEMLAAVRPEEAVLVPGAARYLGHDTIHALNRMFGGGGQGQPGHFAQGGIIGNVGNWFSHIGHGLNDWLHKAFDIGRIVAALSTGNSTAMIHAIDALIGHKTPAAGELARVMIGLPQRLFADAAKHLASMVGLGGDGSGMGTGTQGGLGGSANGQALVRFAESFIGRVPYVFGGTSLTSGVDCSGFTMDILEHFGFSPPRTSEQQWGWVQRVPKPVLGGLVFGTGSSIDPPPGHVGIVTGSNQMVDAYGTGFGVRLNSIYGSMGPVLGFGVPPGGGLEGKTFDRGGWLPPGWLNGTGRPEAVLDPDESQALKAMAKALASGRMGGGAVVNQYFVGAGFPSAEQKAAMHREMALALG